MEIEERFWRKVDFDPHDEARCWVWVATRTRGGYGQFGLARKMVLAHRLAYEMEWGEIPDGLDLDHLCRNRACVNPRHLEPVSKRENALRGFSPSGNNARKTSCPRGHIYDCEEVESGGVHRRCLACKREFGKLRQREYRARKAATP